MNSLLTMKCSYFKYTRLYISLSMPTVSVIYQLSTGNTPSPSAPLPPSLTLQLWTHYSVSLFTCEGSAQLILCELHRGSATHDSLFIMTDVICHTLIYCSKWWTGARRVPRHCVIKMLTFFFFFSVCVCVSWQAVWELLSPSWPREARWSIMFGF